MEGERGGVGEEEGIWDLGGWEEGLADETLPHSSPNNQKATKNLIFIYLYLI